MKALGGALILMRALKKRPDMLLHLAELSSATSLEKHTTPLQLGGTREEADKMAAENMRTW